MIFDKIKIKQKMKKETTFQEMINWIKEEKEGEIPLWTECLLRTLRYKLITPQQKKPIVRDGHIFTECGEKITFSPCEDQAILKEIMDCLTITVQQSDCIAKMVIGSFVVQKQAQSLKYFRILAGFFTKKEVEQKIVCNCGDIFDYEGDLLCINPVWIEKDLLKYFKNSGKDTTVFEKRRKTVFG